MRWTVPKTKLLNSELKWHSWASVMKQCRIVLIHSTMKAEAYTDEGRGGIIDRRTNSAMTDWLVVENCTFLKYYSLITFFLQALGVTLDFCTCILLSLNPYGEFTKSICLSVYLSVCLFACMSAYLLIYLAFDSSDLTLCNNNNNYYYYLYYYYYY